jgi:hypothetical protein
VRHTSNDSLSFVSRGNTWSIASQSSNVHVVLWDNRDGNYEIYYKRSTNAGATWEPDMRLTNNPAISGSSSIAVSGDTVHVVWNDNRTVNWGLYYKRSPNAGISGHKIPLPLMATSAQLPLWCRAQKYTVAWSTHR